MLPSPKQRDESMTDPRGATHIQRRLRSVLFVPFRRGGTWPQASPPSAPALSFSASCPGAAFSTGRLSLSGGRGYSVALIAVPIVGIIAYSF